MSYEIGTAADYQDLLSKLDAFLTGQGTAFGLSYQGTGNGTLDAYAGGASSVAETFTITATSATVFSVVGSISGSLGSATVATPFAHAKLAFTITAGGTAFVIGDVFTISTAPPWIRRRGPTAGSSTRWRINCQKNEGSFGLRMARVEMMTAIGGADQVAGSGGTASQVATSGSQVASFAADTDPATFSLTPSEVAWWEYLFTGAKAIVEVAITAAQASFTDAPQDFTIEYWDGSAWVIAKSVRNETAWASSERRVFRLVDYIWEAPGNSGLEQILVGVSPHENAATGWYNWRLNGFTAFDAAVGWFRQPGAISDVDPYGPMLPLSNAALGYWFVANGRHIAGFVKAGSIYGALYLGFPLPYASPGQWPYPLFVGGSLAFADEPSFTDTRYLVGSAHERHSTFVMPGIPSTFPDAAILTASQARLRKPDGQWGSFYARSSAYDVKDAPETPGSIWPYAYGFNNLKPDLDGDYSMLPVVYLQASPNNVYCQLDGILAVSGSGLSAEALLSVPRAAPASGFDTYLAFPDVNRSTAADFFAVKLD